MLHNFMSRHVMCNCYCGIPIIYTDSSLTSKNTAQHKALAGHFPEAFWQKTIGQLATLHTNYQLEYKL